MAQNNRNRKEAVTLPTSNGMEAIVYNQKGKEAGNIKLPKGLFDAKWKADLVHQVVTVMQGNKRSGTAHTKDRGEVRGGGKKPWQQKGTGRARHGSIRSPLWSGGGVTHGPRKEKNYKRDLSRSMKASALQSVLSKKFRDGEIVFVNAITLSAPKTKEALAVMRALSGVKGLEGLLKKRVNSLLLALPSRDEAVEKSFRNFASVTVEEIRNINPVELLNYRHLIIVNPEASLKTLSERVNK